MYSCKFCSKVCVKPGSLAVHEKACKSNPNRKPQPNHWTKYPDWKISDETREKWAIAGRGRRHSEETKKLISEKRKTFLAANPDKVPYLVNHYSKGDSYPEKYFDEVFKNEGIEVQKKHRIYLYELDFCNLENKIDIEIDGDQHYLDPRIVESDKRRTEYLEDLGWKVYRIKWSDYQKKTYAEKAIIIEEIKGLLRS